MAPRHVVLLTSSESPHPTLLPFYKQHPSVTPLEATLTKPPASVHSKRLAEKLNLLESSLTKQGGGGPPPLRFTGHHPPVTTPGFRVRFVLETFRSLLCPKPPNPPRPSPRAPNPTPWARSRCPSTATTA